MYFEYLHNPFGYAGPLVPLVMFGLVPAIFFIFNQFPARLAIVVSFIGAWLFLPEVQMPLPGLPDYSKFSAISYTILAATIAFDVKRLTSFRFGLMDIPMLVWCVCPMISSLMNGLGLFDGAAALLDQTVRWGFPYFLGRIYLADLKGLRYLAIGIFIGGLVYAPLCLYEARMSPQLHAIFYGAFPHADFGQAVRYGGFRPNVFLAHGLAVGAWMMAATLAGFWLWQGGTIKKIRKIKVRWLFLGLLVTFFSLKSTGAYALFIMGSVLLFVSQKVKTSILVLGFVFSVWVYLGINALTESYFTDQLINFLSNVFNADRIASLEFRFNSEELMVDHARHRIIFGWAGWGRSLVTHPETGKPVVPDSYWILAIGPYGLVGLISLFSTYLVPVTQFCLKYPAKLWKRTDLAPAAAVTMIVLMYSTESLLNAQFNPIYVLCVGGLTGFVMKPPQLSRRKRKVKSAPPVMKPTLVTVPVTTASMPPQVPVGVRSRP